METPRRPWYRKKRWQAALAAPLLAPLLLYPTAARHAMFLAGRGDLRSSIAKRLALHGAWPATAVGPLGEYQRDLQSSHMAGMSDKLLELRVREFEAMAGKLDQGPIRADFEEFIGKLRTRKDRRRAEYWLLPK